jgi:ribosomal peptide maturation radical SAM protein 1
MADPVVLVAMPWAMPRRPSLQIGLLHAVLADADIEVVSCSAFIDFLELACERSALDDESPLRPSDFEAVAAHHYLGEWIFSGAAFGQVSKTDERYLEHLIDVGEPSSLVEAARKFRRYVPHFLNRLCDQLINLSPVAIGFTTTFGQTIASIAAATKIKQALPLVKIVFGGANCEGVMGQTLLREFDCIDLVVQGEGEDSAVRLFKAIRGGESVHSSPGILSRLVPPRNALEAIKPAVPMMDALPAPNFDEFFERLDRSPLRSILKVGLSLPIETSRGCWWGAKSHCSFCGLNGLTMAYRSKSPERSIEDFVNLAQRYQILDFTAVDNILDLSYFQSMFPKLAELGLDLTLFYETKANLSKKQVAILRNAGVTDIQPGLESLSTPILKLMKKGTTALQNIRLLKWCREANIRVHWNLIYGFPGEDPVEYDRMAHLVPSLMHLEAPNTSRLGLERFSPYQKDPTKYGIQITGANPFYRYSYPCDDATLSDLAYSFEYQYMDGRDPAAYSHDLREALARWRETAQDGKRLPALSYRRGPGFIEIFDKRTSTSPSTIKLGESEAAIYVACDSGASVEQVCRSVVKQGHDCPPQEVRAFLDDLTNEQLIYEEGGVYLSLACSSSVAS